MLTQNIFLCEIGHDTFSDLNAIAGYGHKVRQRDRHTDIYPKTNVSSTTQK